MLIHQTITTQLRLIDTMHPDPDLIAYAAALIRRGKLVAFPTETVYGLGADALNAEAATRIFTAKERPASDPLIVHIAALAEITALTPHLPAVALCLAEHFWPGPLTLVLPKTAIVPDIVTADGPTVAVRCPSHPVAQALIRAAGTPIAAPSANRFSHTSPTTAQHVWDDLAGRIDLILDGGATTIGVESTVLDVTGKTPRLLRPGGVTVEEIEALIGSIQRQARQQSDKPLPSPGLLDRHYAPQAEMWLFRGDDQAVREAMRQAAHEARRAGKRVGLLIADEDAPAFTSFDVAIECVGKVTNLEEVAQRLFATLRKLDAAGVELILSRDFADIGLGLAIQDRLRRAAKRLIQIGIRGGIASNS